MIPKLKKANFTTTIVLFLFSINNIGINKIVVSNMVSFGKKNFKYLIGYKDANKNRPFCIFLPKMSSYRRDFDETKYIYIFW